MTPEGGIKVWCINQSPDTAIYPLVHLNNLYLFILPQLWKVSAVLNMFCSLLPAKLLSGVHHYLTKSLSPSLMALSTSVAISSSLSATHTSLLFISLSKRPQSLYFPSTINLSEPSVIVESSHFFSRISWVQCVFIISTSLLQELPWLPPMSKNVCPLP